MKKYSEDVQNALEANQNGLPLRESAKRFSIPRTTLQFRRSNKFNNINFGPNLVLTAAEENIIVEWIIENHKKGFPRRKEDIQESVKEFLEKTPRSNPFVNNYPGEGWYKSFLRRRS
ncbi:hypothetical protein NQ314_005952 [Rhamnusium bicolor]|uniref:HTH CENPB-type domain-containing protein n=1 Tax=Rhamnusium bicolor TaxID=1586634 RepID=A0AAV8ZDB3_9CUCU|nr:hypothetical protein NQ314_005952 [Rhamnusium bicolor]